MHNLCTSGQVFEMAVSPLVVSIISSCMTRITHYAVTTSSHVSCSLLMRYLWYLFIWSLWVRNDDRPFRGVQVKFAGDFYQLAPAPNILYGDSGSFCIESSLFNRLHHLNLTHVHRQRDSKFISIIREVSTDHFTDVLNSWMTYPSLRIYRWNFKTVCDWLAQISSVTVNAMMLYHLPGSFKMFKSRDIDSPK